MITRRKLEKNTNTWRLNNVLLNSPWFNKEIKKEIKKYLETNGNKTFQNLRGTAKAVLKGKFITIQAYLENIKKFQINNLTLYLKELEKTNNQPKPKVGRKKEIIKIRVEIN